MGKEKIDEKHISSLDKAIDEMKDPTKVFGPFDSIEDLFKTLDEED